MNVLAIHNAKGGTGKSTFTMIFATHLASEGYRVCIYDCDAQRSLVGMYARSEGIENLQVLEMPSHKIPRRIKATSKKHDVVFLDLPRITDGVDNAPILAALEVCDGLLIPVIATNMDLDSLEGYIPVIKKIGIQKVAGFINKHGRQKRQTDVNDVIQEIGLHTFDNNAPYLEQYALAEFSLFKTKKEKERFAKLYSEFKKYFINGKNIKK